MRVVCFAGFLVMLIVTSVGFSDTQGSLRLEEIPRNEWVAAIHRIAQVQEPALANTLITQAHFDLSVAMQALLGRSKGANFHTWATWGSFKARSTITRKDFPLLETVFNVENFDCRSRLDAECLALKASKIYGAEAERASLEILRGNRLVLQDIGSVTAMFIEWFVNDKTADPHKLERFLAAIPSDGGVRKMHLRNAFRAYWMAKYTSDEILAQNYLLLGNLSAILSEHLLLQPIIEAAMPTVLSTILTRYQLGFKIGSEFLSVSADVPQVTPNQSYPMELQHIQLPELSLFIKQWGRTSGLKGSAAKDWLKLEERMKFITSLFRSRQMVPQLYDLPRD